MARKKKSLFAKIMKKIDEVLKRQAKKKPCCPTAKKGRKGSCCGR